jgi:cytochrome c peroxidase
MGDRTMTILPHSCHRKSPRVAVGLVLVMLASSLAAPAPCRAQVARDAVNAGTFTRPRLLKRFDTNTDGRLNVAEKAALRRAFGGIDVPMLPAPTLDYSRIRRPEHVDASYLAGADNTPEINPLTNHGATLGRVLFYDRQLSRNLTIACVSCHLQRAAFTDPRQFSRGFQGKLTRRNSMSLVNLRFTNLNGLRPGFFWDERAATLEDQVLMPIQDPIEMGMKLQELIPRLEKLPYYPDLFEAAFGSKSITNSRVARALAQFLRSMVSLESRYDLAAASKDDDIELTRLEQQGETLFVEGVGGIAEFACAMCHVPPTFNMPKAQNIGLDLPGIRNIKKTGSKKDRKNVTGGKPLDRGLGELGRPSNDTFTKSNDGKFKAPSLRNVALTAPYMHDGRFKTLEQVIAHYSGKVRPHPNLGLAFEDDSSDKRESGFQFTRVQQQALVAFLKTLTDKSFVADAKFSDPFLRTRK